MIKSGVETSEHKRALRAEALGAALALVGAVLAFIHPWPGVVLCLMGGLIVGATAVSYAHARSTEKAAIQTKRAAAQAPRHI